MHPIISIQCQSLPDTTIYPETIQEQEFVLSDNDYGESHKNPSFNQWVIDEFAKDKQISILDLGCGGGGMIEDFINIGNIGVGLDVRNGYYLRRAYSWGTRPNNLFRCDITRPFQIYFDEKPAKFDIITSFEVFEHIHPSHIDNLLSNIQNHSHEKTVLLLQISTNPYEWVHRTILPRTEWLNIFSKYNLEFKGCLPSTIRPDCKDQAISFILKYKNEI